jgi:hypothetical protein
LVPGTVATAVEESCVTMKKLIRTEPGRGAIKKTKTRETFERKLLSNKHKTVYPFLILAALYAFLLMKIIGEFRLPVRHEERVLVRSSLGVVRLVLRLCLVKSNRTLDSYS